MESSYLKLVNKEIQDFRTRPIQVVPGFMFNQYELVKQIFFYYNSKFTTGDIDDDGDRKYFLNIVKNPCKIFTKAIDFDTKNIRLLTVGGGDPLKTWFMERDLKLWMREQQFGKVLNRIFREIPIYGSVVLKIINGKPYFVDLRNFVIQQSAETVDAANYIIEVHNYTPAQFRAAAKEMKWGKEKVNEVIDKFHKTKDATHIKLYERYGELPNTNDQGETDYTYKRLYIADVGEDEYNDRGQLIAEHTGVILGEDPYDGNPYWEFHAEKMAGRWLGIGVVETLIEPQIRQNELANLQTKTSYWSALRVFQTRDPAVNRNMLSDVSNGEILNVDSEITQIDMSDRNLAFFNEEEQKWMRNRDELTFSYDVVQGERLPAGTPLGSAQLAMQQTLTYFETIQENIALDIKEMLYSVVIPQFEKERSLEHTIRLIGRDLDEYIRMVRNQMTIQEVIKFALKNRKLPSEKEKEAIAIGFEEAIRQGKEQILTVPLGFYKNIKYDADIDITGESVDTRVRSATLFAILQAITADPTMTTDPVKRKFLYTMGEDNGLNMSDYLGEMPEGVEQMVSPELKRAGGGVSAPFMSQQIPGQQTATL